MKSAAERDVVEHDQMVQALPPNRTHHPLDIGSLPGGSRGGPNLMDSQVGYLAAEFIPEDSITIAQQVARELVKWECLPQLLSGPFGRGVSGHIEVNNTTTVVGQDQKHVKNLETGCEHCKEVDGNQLLGMILQEGAPGLRTAANAPLAESRRRYLEHLAAQGAAIHTIRAAAGVIYRATMMMKLDESSPVERKDVEPQQRHGPTAGTATPAAAVRNKPTRTFDKRRATGCASLADCEKSDRPPAPHQREIDTRPICLYDACLELSSARCIDDDRFLISS